MTSSTLGVVVGEAEGNGVAVGDDVAEAEGMEVGGGTFAEQAMLMTQEIANAAQRAISGR